MGGMLSCLALNLCECACCTGLSIISNIFGSSLSNMSRFGHLLVLIVTFVIAMILGKQYPNDINGYNYYTKVELGTYCDNDYTENCIFRQLIYRSSFSLFIVFFFLAATSYFSDYVNRSFWILKFGAAIGLFIGFWWGSNSFFSGWAEATRIVSFFWLLVQGLLLIDFSHDLHDLFISKTSNQEDDDIIHYILYLGASFAALAGAILGLVYLFMDYTGCGLGMFFTVLTLLIGVLTTFVSLLNSVSRGLLTPCIIFAYSVFMCWYALLSNPDESCNPNANDLYGSQDGAMIAVSVISVLILFYCVFNGTRIFNIFNPNADGVMKSYIDGDSNNELEAVLTDQQANNKDVVVVQQPTGNNSSLSRNTESTNNPEKIPLIPNDHLVDHDDNVNIFREGEEEKSSGTPHERVFFHIVMILIACYGAMILTSWGNTKGSPDSKERSVSYESMWLKIVAQWVLLILYMRILQVSYQNNLTEE